MKKIELDYLKNERKNIENSKPIIIKITIISHIGIVTKLV